MGEDEKIEAHDFAELNGIGNIDSGDVDVVKIEFDKLIHDDTQIVVEFFKGDFSENEVGVENRLITIFGQDMHVEIVLRLVYTENRSFADTGL